MTSFRRPRWYDRAGGHLFRTPGAVTQEPLPAGAREASLPGKLFFEPNLGAGPRRNALRSSRRRLHRASGGSCRIGGGYAKRSAHFPALGGSTGGGRAPRPGAAHARQLPAGSDPAHWRTDVRTYGKLHFRGVYEGIDLVYYGRGEHLQYDLIVQPGAHPSAAAWRVEGAKALSLSAEGDLPIETDGGMLRQRRPYVYQAAARGIRRSREGSYCGAKITAVFSWPRMTPMRRSSSTPYSTMPLTWAAWATTTCSGSRLRPTVQCSRWAPRDQRISLPPAVVCQPPCKA